MATPIQASAPAESCHVVGIGASAGGIEAMYCLLQALPAEPALALVVVQHQLPGGSDELVNLVSKWTLLPVRAANNGERPEPNHVYVAGSDDVLTLEGGLFRTRPVDGGSRRPGIDTIDAFLESLAQDRGSHALAAILCGTGTDGAAGAICVKRAGGVVLVQDPVTTMNDSMPRAVISRGAADYILPVGEIAKQLLRCASPAYVRPANEVAWTGEITRTLDEIVGLIRKQAGFDLGGYKATPLLWRIQQRMDLRRTESFGDYESLLRDDPAELEALIRGIPIHVTEFFRDAPAWDVLRHEVIEPMLSERRASDVVRAWTPACATGEEAYSVAMLLHEHAEKTGRPIDFQVFATDASPEIVARASRGAFSSDALKNVSSARQQKFFYSTDGNWRVKRHLREKMVFAPQDLLLDPPFRNLDLVTCRNLLIYLDPEAVKRVVFLLHNSLKVGGYLFLGKGEPLLSRQGGFNVVSSRWHIYRKTGPASDVEVRFPLRVATSLRASAVPFIGHSSVHAQRDFPSVLIDDEFRVLRVYGDTEKYLRVPAGQPTDNLLELTQRELASSLKAAAKIALEDGQPTIVNGLREEGNVTHAFQIRLTPIRSAQNGAAPRLLASFISRAREIRPGATEPVALPSHAADVAASSEWSEAIRISREELEASREELQVLNEELKAANEQLNLVNDDLNQANARLTGKIAELEMQSGVLSAGAVMAMFLDQALRVRWFTPSICEIFPLKTGDVGRGIADISPKVDDVNFLRDVLAVMQSGTPREAEVRNASGGWFLRRIRPFLSQTGTSGVAVTVTDISDLKHAERVLRESAMHDFMVRFANALRGLSGYRNTRSTAIRMLRQQFGAARVNYSEARGPDELEIVATDALAGTADMLGRRCAINDAGPALTAALFTGRSGWSNDVMADPAASAAERRACHALGIGAWANMPFVQSGRVLGALTVHFDTAHTWAPDELMFLELMAERTWAAVGRARAEEDLRARNEELERSNKAAIGRELRMIDLKNEVNELRRQLGQSRRYAMESDDHDDRTKAPDRN
ncbi:CheR family methyltransferase [Paraburkholderia youngii]|uniref:CheR family methyltransferase n=1 Tax=Paraburkholderia youngii TaxID=2782701 RepID=UPI003D217373